MIEKIRELNRLPMYGDVKLMAVVASTPRSGEDHRPGSIVWRRCMVHKKRYRAYRYREPRYSRISADRATLVPLNVTLLYKKVRRRWVIYIDDEPMNDGYIRRQSAMTSISPNILDRLAAEA